MTTTIKKYAALYWQNYIKPTDPLSEHFKFAIRGTLLSLIAVLLAQQLFPEQILWSVLSGEFALFFYHGNTHYSRITKQFLYSVLMISTGALAALLGTHQWIYPLYIFVMSLVLYYQAQKNPSFYLPVILITCFVITNGSFSTLNHDLFLRVLASSMGVMIAMIICSLCWRYQPLKILQQNSQLIFDNMSDYLKFVIRDILRGNYLPTLQQNLKIKTINSFLTSRNILVINPNKYFQDLYDLQLHLIRAIVGLSNQLNYPLVNESLFYSAEVLQEMLRKWPRYYEKFSAEDEKILQQQFEMLKITAEQSDNKELKEDLLCIHFYLEKILMNILQITSYQKWQQSA